MTAFASDAADAAIPPSDEARAMALWIFVRTRAPHFGSAQALDVVRELVPAQNEDVKALARRLRPILRRKGIALKHSHALDAAARVLGHPSWHAGGSQAASPPLQLRCHFPGFDGPLDSWDEAMKIFGDYCEGEISAEGTCLYHFEFTANSVSMNLPFTASQDGSRMTFPLMQIQWSTAADRKQLTAAVSAVEGLRRRLEETSRGLVDGLAAVQFCLHTPHPEARFDDPLNSELVVVDVTPGPSYHEEITRGDEVKCWADLEELYSRDAVYTADGSRWLIRATQLEWSLSTLRASAAVPQILTRPLTSEETARLLRRQRNAVRAGRIFFREDRIKRLDLMRVDALGVDVNWDRVNLELARRQVDWRDFQETMRLEHDAPNKLSTSAFAGLLAFLDGPSPSELIRKPKRSELVLLDDDRILRTFVSRVQDVVYEVPRRMEDALVKVVDDAINVLLTALRMEIETTEGVMIEGFPRGGPYLIHANSGKELLAQLKKHSLVAYAGLTTHVEGLQIDEYRSAESKPLRFDRVLFLDIDFEEPR